MPLLKSQFEQRISEIDFQSVESICQAAADLSWKLSHVQLQTINSSEVMNYLDVDGDFEYADLLSNQGAVALLLMIFCFFDDSKLKTHKFQSETERSSALLSEFGLIPWEPIEDWTFHKLIDDCGGIQCPFNTKGFYIVTFNHRAGSLEWSTTHLVQSELTTIPNYVGVSFLSDKYEINIQKDYKETNIWISEDQVIDDMKVKEISALKAHELSQLLDIYLEGTEINEDKIKPFIEINFI